MFCFGFFSCEYNSSHHYHYHQFGSFHMRISMFFFQHFTNDIHILFLFSCVCVCVFFPVMVHHHHNHRNEKKKFLSDDDLMIMMMTVLMMVADLFKNIVISLWLFYQKTNFFLLFADLISSL